MYKLWKQWENLETGEETEGVRISYLNGVRSVSSIFGGLSCGES